MPPLRLNLAAGTDIRDGWTNLDVVAWWPLARRGCDVIWDARRDLLPYGEGAVDEVYAGYLFLHLAPHHHRRVLADIFRVLRPGGRLVVGEVEMDAVLRRWLEAPGDPRLSELIWGEQGELPPVKCDTCEGHLAKATSEAANTGIPFSYMLCSSCMARREQQRLAEFDEHHCGFTEITLRAFLRGGGFGDVRRIRVHSAAVWYELTLSCFKPYVEAL